MAFRQKEPAVWTLEDVQDFLQDLGLGHVAPAFKENGVDGPFLLVLSDEDLERELGLKPLQIRKLTSALTAAKAGPTAAPTAPAMDTRVVDQVAPPAAAAPPSAPAFTAAPVAVAPPPAAPVAQGPHPNLLQAQQLLTSADAHLAQASSLLTRATASQAAQTGAQMAGGRRGMTLTGLALDSRQRQQTNTAGDSAWAALQAIQSARQLVPDLPHIREPQVKAASSPLLQGLTRGPMLDALRTGKAQMSRESVETCRSDLAAARHFLSGRIAASAAPAQPYQQPQVHYQAAPAGYVPPQMAAAPQGGYAPPPVFHQPPPQQVPMAHGFGAPPPARPSGGAGVGVALMGGLLGASAARRRMGRR